MLLSSKLVGGQIMVHTVRWVKTGRGSTAGTSMWKPCPYYFTKFISFGSDVCDLWLYLIAPRWTIQ